MSRDRSDGGGWIHLWRSFRKHPNYFANEGRKATNQDALLDLWLSASHRDEVVYSQGETIPVQRGQVLTAVLALADRWKWSRGRVERFLVAGELRGELVQKRSSRRTVLTICNYDKWNGADATDRATDEHLTGNRRAPDGHVQESENLRIKEFQNSRLTSEASLVTENRAEASDRTIDGARILISRCQRLSELMAGHALPVLGNTLKDMVHLRGVRDDETIEEVFEHFATHRRNRETFNFSNFLRFYDQHETATIKAVKEEKSREKALQAHRPNGNGSGSA